MNIETGLVVGTELPFGRVMGESERAFACFRLFLELGEERTLSAVAEKAGESLYTLKRWAWRYAWEERVQGYYEWAEENPRTGDGGPRTAADERSEVGGQKSGQMTEDGGRRTEDRGQRSERLVGGRLRRAAERALKRYGCEQQSRKVGLGEIARTFATALRLEQREPDKGKGKDTNGLSAEESAVLDREFEAALDKMLESEEAKTLLNAYYRAQEGRTREDGLKTPEKRTEVSGQRSEVGEQRSEVGDQRSVPSERTQEGTWERQDLKCGMQKENSGTASATPSAAVPPPPSWKKKKPQQGTMALREWVRRKYGVQTG